MDRRQVNARELEVVTLVSQGLSNGEIATVLGTSATTVKRHLAHVMLKWNAANRTEVAVQAVLRGAVRTTPSGPTVTGRGVCPLCRQPIAEDTPARTAPRES